MKTSWFLLLLTACIAAAGCRQDPYLTAVIESMNMEKRHLEDRVYEMEDEYELLQDKLESTRRENNKLRQQGGSAVPDEPAPSSTKPPRSSIFPRGTSPGKSGASPELKEPDIDLGTPSAPGTSSGKPPTGGLEMNEPGERSLRNPHELPPPKSDGDAAEAEPEDKRVTHIVLNPLLTGGHDFDNKPGDDGVSIIIEPRNADDQFVPLAAPVSIVVIDPAVAGDEGRIARWDFDADEISRRIKKTRLGRGINLKLPWPNQPPEHNKVKIFVRYERLDGLKLEADREVSVALPGQFSQRWTPRSLEPAGTRGSEAEGALVNHTEELSPSGSIAKKPAETARRPVWKPER